MNAHIKNVLFLLLLVFSAGLVRASSSEGHEAKILLRVHSIKEAEVATGFPIQLENEGLIDVLRKLRPEDEVLLKGLIEYHSVTKDNRTEMNPTFHVQEIRAVSLERLGIKGPVIVDTKKEFLPETKISNNVMSLPYGVVETLTLTGSVLLIQNLAETPTENSPSQNLNRQVLFSAAALATGYMLWQQLTKKPKKD